LTALAEMLPVDLTNAGKDAFYEIADLIYTKTYFEGNCLKNTLAKRGKSKQKRSDCPLVTMALVANQHYPYIVIERRPGDLPCRQAGKDYPAEFQSVWDTSEKISPDNKQAVYIKKIPFDEGLPPPVRQAGSKSAIRQRHDKRLV